MDSFFYSAVSDVLVGAGTSTQLGDLAASMGIQRALIVTDPGIIKFGLLDGAVANLKANNIEFSIFETFMLVRDDNSNLMLSFEQDFSDD